MLELAGRRVDVVLDAGLLGFNGWGWPPEWLAILTHQLRPTELAAISKTLTWHPTTGNFRWYMPWRSIRYLWRGNWVNSYGLSNPGVASLRGDLQAFCRRVAIPIISVLPPDQPDNAALFAYELAAVVGLDLAAVEINASCPNHEAVPMEGLPAVIGEMRRHLHCPLIVKMGRSNDLAGQAMALEEHCDCLHLINSVPWDMIFPSRKSPLIEGGVSGPIIFPAARRSVCEVRAAGFAKPIIGGGGINSLVRAQSMGRAGADAVAIGTAIHHDPALAHRIAEKLRES